MAVTRTEFERNTYFKMAIDYNGRTPKGLRLVKLYDDQSDYPQFSLADIYATPYWIPLRHVDVDYHYESLGKLQPGAKVRVVRKAAPPDHKFRIGSVVTIKEIPTTNKPDYMAMYCVNAVGLEQYVNWDDLEAVPVTKTDILADTVGTVPDTYILTLPTQIVDDALCWNDDNGFAAKGPSFDRACNARGALLAAIRQQVPAPIPADERAAIALLQNRGYNVNKEG